MEASTWQPLIQTAHSLGSPFSGSRTQGRGSGRDARYEEVPQQDADLEEQEEEYLQRRQALPGWTVDRGTGYHAEERLRHKRPFLVETGRHAGRSRVKLAGLEWRKMMGHVLKRDFFHAAVNARLRTILISLFVIQFVCLVLWAFMYYFAWCVTKECFVGFTGLASAMLFSIETQQTIGYGSRAPGNCWISALLIGTHSIISVIIDSVIIGIVFARISHPKYRGRTILMSDCACIARRDGVLKFMVRVADIKKSHIMAPTLRAVLYTWGDGRTTQEGEHRPLKRQLLKIQPWDQTLLLPVIVEHVIDEKSPLYGLTLHALEAVNAEIVIQLEGCTELGDMFMVRRSYLPQEIYWGHVFTTIVKAADVGATEYSVDISRFHEVEPQPGINMFMMPMSKLSSKVVKTRNNSTLPADVLSESSLVLADDLVVGPRNGKLFLMIRLADRNPGQMIDVRVQAFVYRWSPVVTQEGETLPYTVEELDLEPANPILRYPVTILHEVNICSPLSNWSKLEGKRMDADAEIVVVAKGLLYSTGEPVALTRAYPVLSTVKWGHVHAPIITCESTSSKPVVDWCNFHNTIPFNPLPPGAPSTLKRVPSKMSLAKSTELGPQGGRGVSVSGASSKSIHTQPKTIGQTLNANVHFQEKVEPTVSTNTPEGGTSMERLSTSSADLSQSDAPVLPGESWKQKRSLFTALEEMHQLMEEAEAEKSEEIAAAYKEVTDGVSGENVQWKVDL